MPSKRKPGGSDPKKSAEPDRKIIVAVDLQVPTMMIINLRLHSNSGTTFTGIAWAQTRKVQDDCESSPLIHVDLRIARLPDTDSPVAYSNISIPGRKD